MSTAEEILHEISTHVIGEQRLLADLVQKRQDHPSFGDVLDPVISKLEQLVRQLSETRDHLRLAAVAKRT